MQGQENSSAQPGGVADGGNIMSTPEWGRKWSFFSPHFSFDLKTVAQ